MDELEKVLNAGETENTPQEKTSAQETPPSAPEPDESPETPPEEPETKEGEAEDKESKLKTYTETEFQKELTKRAQAMKDKELVPVYAERDTLKDKISELESQIADKEIDRDLESIFKGDTEEYGEEQAKKRQDSLRKFSEHYKEYQAKSHIHAKLDEIAVKIGTREKTVSIREALLDWRDKGFAFDVNEVREKLEQATDPKTFEVVKNAIASELKAKTDKKPFRPSPGRSGGGGGIDLKKLSGRELLNRGYAKEQKK